MTIERDAKRHFQQIYQGEPPWDIGRAQQAVVWLSDGGEVTGSVLDLGCGTGEHALFLASRGHEVVGVDIVPEAIEKARKKARERGIEATFLVGDALDLRGLSHRFDTVLDSGFFHTLSDPERRCYVEGLANALRPEGRVHLLCFSDFEPGEWGPRRVSRAEIREIFDEGWTVGSIRDAIYEHRLNETGARAYLSTLGRNGTS